MKYRILTRIKTFYAITGVPELADKKATSLAMLLVIVIVIIISPSAFCDEYLKGKKEVKNEQFIESEQDEEIAVEMKGKIKNGDVNGIEKTVSNLIIDIKKNSSRQSMRKLGCTCRIMMELQDGVFYPENESSKTYKIKSASALVGLYHVASLFYAHTCSPPKGSLDYPACSIVKGVVVFSNDNIINTKEAEGEYYMSKMNFMSRHLNMDSRDRLLVKNWKENRRLMALEWISTWNDLTTQIIESSNVIKSKKSKKVKISSDNKKVNPEFYGLEIDPCSYRGLDIGLLESKELEKYIECFNFNISIMRERRRLDMLEMAKKANEVRMISVIKNLYFNDPRGKKEFLDIVNRLEDKKTKHSILSE